MLFDGTRLFEVNSASPHTHSPTDRKNGKSQEQHKPVKKQTSLSLMFLHALYLELTYMHTILYLYIKPQTVVCVCCLVCAEPCFCTFPEYSVSLSD